ncbi:hypothetical protein LTR84_013053 [Exophiala bonariae]|uniref:Uncharacterized protein n=1 Tax=Exophiala bonariae TaxID=1690606 RepID=A0AAV9NFY0_9EURO|nr:hypothetical protein LTR84_013053 [Exophiala bonariae]
MGSLLLTSPAEDVQLAILGVFFDNGNHVPDQESLKPFLEYYKKETAELDFGVQPRISENHMTVLRTHDDIIHTVNILKGNQDSTRLEIRKLLNRDACRFASTPDHEINLAIDLSLRLWLMLNVRCPETRFLTPSAQSIQWDDTTTLRQFIVAQFPRRSLNLEPKQSRLSHMFTVSFMFTIPACFTLRDNFHTEYALPRLDEDTDKLLKQYGQEFHHLAPFDGSRMLNLNEFEFWGERLLEVYEEVFLSPPVSLRQLWSDRRSPQQWSVFWTAQIILTLTIVSCMATFVQTWASVRALRLAEESTL